MNVDGTSAAQEITEAGRSDFLTECLQI